MIKIITSDNPISPIFNIIYIMRCNSSSSFGLLGIRKITSVSPIINPFLDLRCRTLIYNIDVNDTRKLDQKKQWSLKIESRKSKLVSKDKLLTDLKKNNYENLIIIAIAFLWIIIEYLLRFSD